MVPNLSCKVFALKLGLIIDLMGHAHADFNEDNELLAEIFFVAEASG